MIIDLGTGDGRSVLARAAEDPRALVFGIDADATAMAEASRRAARSARKGGLPNALFVAAGATGLGPVLDASADLVTVSFPWGSLLRGVLGADQEVAAALARLPRAGGSVDALVSVTERDAIDGLGRLDAEAIEALRHRHASNGLRLVDACPATSDDVRATRSTWCRRLTAGGSDRPVWRLRFERDGHETGPSYALALRRHTDIVADR